MKKIVGIIIAANLLIALSAGCGYAFSYSPALNKAVAEFLKGNFNQAMDESALVQSRGGSALQAQVLHLQGHCMMQIEEYSQARDMFKKAIPYAQGMLRTEVYMGIGDAYFKDAMYPQAISVYKQLIDQGGNTDHLAGLYYKIAKSHQKHGEFVKANTYFDLLAKKFPDSLESQLAKQTSPDATYFTVQVGSFANRTNAKKLHDDLRAKGYEAHISPLQSRNRTLYRVRVGEYASRMAASYAEEQLRTQESLPTRIFP